MRMCGVCICEDVWSVRMCGVSVRMCESAE